MKKGIIAGLGVAIIAIVGAGAAGTIYYTENNWYSNISVNKSVEVEYTGKKISVDFTDFLDSDTLEAECELTSDNDKIKKVGDYQFVLTVKKPNAILIKSQQYDVTLSIVDTTAPVFSDDCPDKIEVYQNSALPDLSTIFSTDDENVTFTIDENQVDLTSAGKYTLNLYATDKNGNVSSKEITIIVKTVSISLNKSKVSLNVGDTQTLTAKVNGESNDVVWATSDTAIVTVENGELTAVSVGTVTITVSANGVNATAEVEVTEAETTTESTTNESTTITYSSSSSSNAKSSSSSSNGESKKSSSSSSSSKGSSSKSSASAYASGDNVDTNSNSSSN